MSKVKISEKAKVLNRKVYDDPEVYHKFLFLKKRLRDETGHISNPSVKINNSNYQAIIKLGKPVLPFLFEDLFSFKCDWLEAIAVISGIDPVKKDHYGQMDLMVEDWKAWQLEHKKMF